MDRPTGRLGGNPVYGFQAPRDKRSDRDDAGRGRHANDHMTGEHGHPGGHLPTITDDLGNDGEAGQNEKDQDGGFDRSPPPLVDRMEFRRFHSTRPEGLPKSGDPGGVAPPGGGDIVPLVFPDESVEPRPDFLDTPRHIVVDDPVQYLKSDRGLSVRSQCDQRVGRPDIGDQRSQDRKTRLYAAPLVAVANHRLNVACGHKEIVLAVAGLLYRLGSERPVGRQGPPGEADRVFFLSDPDDLGQWLPSHDRRDQNDDRIPDDLGILASTKVEI